MHHFLTGPRGVGKSSIIHKVNELLPSQTVGFQTVPYLDKQGTLQGFVLESLSALAGDTPDQDQQWIARFDDPAWRIFPETFESLGVSILKDIFAIPHTKTLLVMDELGFFENTAFAFQSQVLSCLDQEEIVVFGVLKDVHTPFINRIRNHPLVCLHPINVNNRNDVVEEMVQVLTLLLER